MNEFHDSDLRDQLQRLGGPLRDDDTAYATMVRRAHTVKRRRALAAITSFGAACLILVAIMTTGSSGSRKVSPADSHIGTDTEQTTTAPSVSPTTTRDEMPSTPLGAHESSTPPTSDEPAPTSSDEESSSTQASTPPPSSSDAPSDPSVSTPAPPSADPTNSGAGGQPSGSPATYTSKGGTITVRVDNGQLVLVDHQAFDGFDFQLEKNEPNRIKVRFNGPNGRAQIEVLIAEGHAIPMIRFESNVPDNTIEDGLGADDHGDSSGHGRNDDGTDGTDDHRGGDHP